MKLSSPNGVEFIVFMKETNNFDEINNFFLNIYWSKIRNYAKLMKKVSMKWKKFQRSAFDTIARRRLVEDHDTILEHTGKIHGLQNEINCMNDSKDFQDAESVRSRHSHVSSQPVSPSSNAWRKPYPFCGNAEPQRGVAKHLGHAWYIEKRFAGPVASSSAPYPQELIPWSSQKSEHTHSSHVGKSENQTPVQDQRCLDRMQSSFTTRS